MDRNSTTSYFVDVPAGAASLQVDLSGLADGSQTRFIAFNPTGLPLESTASTACYANFSDPATCRPDRRSYTNPMPGIWEIEVESRRTSPTLHNPFTLSTQVLGTEVDPASVHLPSVVRGAPTPVSWTVTNRFAPVIVHGEGGSLRSGVESRPSVAEGDTVTVELVVPAEAETLTIAIGNPSDTQADLDLAVYRDGELVGQDADGDSDESVTITDPAPGTYTAEIAGYAVPAGTTLFDYRDVYSSAALGTMAVVATPVALANGASTVVNGTITALADRPAGRSLLGVMNVVTSEGAIVGSATVEIDAVN